MFRVGQRVVCVDVSACPEGSVPWKIITNGLDGLTEGRVYTIRAIGGFAGRDQVWLYEIIRPLVGSIGKKYGECGYRPSRFRPVVERKTDISVFTEILRRASTHTPVGG